MDLSFLSSPWTITAISAIIVFFESAAIFFVWQNAGTTLKEVLKAALWYKSYAIALILQPDGRLMMKAADISDEIPDQWKIPKGKLWDEKRLAEGTQLNGPDRIDYAVWSSEGATSINMWEKAQSELFGTSAYITKIGDLKKAEGYIEGHEASQRTGFESFFRDNWPILLAFVVILGIGLYVLWDKAITGPAGWQAANACEQQKSSIVAQCGKYISINMNATAAAAPPLPTGSGTGGAVV